MHRIRKKGLASNTRRDFIGLKKEGLRVFGAWEPLSFRIRSWPESTTRSIHDEYALEHSEEFIKGLKKRGFNFVEQCIYTGLQALVFIDQGVAD